MLAWRATGDQRLRAREVPRRRTHLRHCRYCEIDVLNTYRVWLRYEVFRGRLSPAEFQASEACLVDPSRRGEIRNRIWGDNQTQCRRLCYGCITHPSASSTWTIS